MQISSLLFMVISYFNAPFVKLWRAVTSTIVVCINTTDFNILSKAVANLLDANLAQETFIQYLQKKAEEDETKYSDIINLGISCVIHLLEQVAVVETQARNTELELLDDLARKDQELNLQARRIEALLKAHDAAQARKDQELNLQARRIEALLKEHDAAQARIATLQSALGESASSHNAQLHTLATRQIAVTKLNIARGHEIDSLKSQIDGFKDAAMARKREQRKNAEKTASKMRIQSGKIEALKTQLSNTRRAHHARQLAYCQINNAQASSIAELQAVVDDTEMRMKTALASENKKAKKMMKKVAGLTQGAADAVAKVIEQEKVVVSLRAKIVMMKRDGAQVAAAAAVREDEMMDRLEAMEQRALAAEERVAKKEQEKDEIREQAYRDVDWITALHAKELTAAKESKTDIKDINTSPTKSKTQPDPSFSLDAPFHFTAQLIVRTDSAFAQASVTGPATPVTARMDRRIVGRGGNTMVTPLLLPPWPEERRREEDMRSPKRQCRG